MLWMFTSRTQELQMISVVDENIHNIALRGKKGVECFIMYPEGRTSRTQELQMISVVDENIHDIALRGTFDDCQATVKACFNDHAFNKEISIAAVNSINWARILAQMVYYVHAYLKVTKP